jgi:hypothetical protein
MRVINTIVKQMEVYVQGKGTRRGNMQTQYFGYLRSIVNFCCTYVGHHVSMNNVDFKTNVKWKG